jgi:hypothetical protein
VTLRPWCLARNTSNGNARMVQAGLHDSRWIHKELCSLPSCGARSAGKLLTPHFRTSPAGHGRLHANIQLDRYIRIRLSQGSTRFAGADCIWKCRTPLKCKGILMAWYTIQLWTSDRGSRHGLNDQTAPCYIYLLEDTTDHSLRSTGLSHCFNASSIQLASPQITDQLEDWWLTSRAHFGTKERRSSISLVFFFFFETRAKALP